MINNENEKPPVPEWLLSTNEYSPPRDSGRYVGKSIASLLGVLNKIRRGRTLYASKLSPALCLLGVILLIVLSSASRNMFFTYCLIAMLLLRCCFLPGEMLREIFRAGVAAALFSALILLPAAFMGQPKSMLTVSIKVFYSVSSLSLMSLAIPWNKMTAGLRVFHIPNIFIQTLDLTLKYIYILGEFGYQMMESVKLRSVGRDRSKHTTLSGVLGAVLLRSAEMSKETHDAMICRGFTGEYGKQNHSAEAATGSSGSSHSAAANAAFCAILAAAVILFIYLN